jgi:hypothetical protein
MSQPGALCLLHCLLLLCAVGKAVQTLHMLDTGMACTHLLLPGICMYVIKLRLKPCDPCTQHKWGCARKTAARSKAVKDLDETLSAHIESQDWPTAGVCMTCHGWCCARPAKTLLHRP